VLLSLLNDHDTNESTAEGDSDIVNEKDESVTDGESKNM